MSVVRKHASGGSVTTTDYTELENYLKDKINKDLTNKSIDFVEQVLPNFIESLKSGGKISDSEYTPKINWAGRILIESPDEAEMQLNYWFKNKDVVKSQNGDNTKSWLNQSNYGYNETKRPEWLDNNSKQYKPNIKSSEKFDWLNQQKAGFNLPDDSKKLSDTILIIPAINPESEDTTIKGIPTQTEPIGNQAKSTTQSTTPKEKIAEIDKEKEEWKNLLHDSITGKLKLLKSKEYSFKPTVYNTKDQLPIKIDETKTPEKKEGFSLNSKDLVDVINVGLYANALSNINKNYRLTNRALSEQMVRQSLLKQPNIRVVTPNISAAEEQVAKANTAANRVANSIADIDKALGYRAQVAKNVGEIEAKTKLGAAQQTEQQLAKVQDIKMKIDQVNTQIENANKGRIADIMSKFHQNAINANLSKQSELNKFVNTLSQNLKVREKDKALNELIKFNKSPEYSALNDEYTKFQEELYDFEQRKAKDPTLSGSQEEKNLEIKKKLLNNKMREMLSQQSSLQTKVQYGMFAKGGSLSDKITLENIKQNNRKELTELKEYYKKMLKSDDLLLKSLIKIFK